MIKKLFFTLLCTAVCRTISAQVVDPYVPAPENLRARTEFQDAKFGIFLHWGLYSLLGTGEWTMTNRNINYQEYAKLANAFYPHDFDAAEWVSAIKSSGAGYVCRGFPPSGSALRLLHDAPPRRVLDVGHRADGLRHRGRHAV